jgi:hypothetical protein
VLIEFPELVRVKIRSKMCDDSVREAESVQNIADEADHSICGELCNWLCRYIQIGVPPARVSRPLASRNS